MQLKIAKHGLSITVSVLIIAVMVTVLIASTQAPSQHVPRIAYLAPSASPFNLYTITPSQPDIQPQQWTDSTFGVYDFGVSADGRFIAYAEMQDSDNADLFLLDLQTNTVRRLTQCVDEQASCTTPSWRPDGQVIAYQRRENAATRGIGSEARIWLLDLTTDPLTTFPLFQQAEILGQDPQWTQNGQRLAFYDTFTQSILIYNFAVSDANQQLQAIPYSNGQVGAISPDGTRLIYPKLITGDITGLRAEFQIAALETGTAHALTDANIPSQDRSTAWNPDGQHAAITRIYPDERFTAGDQVYLVDTFTSTIQPLIYDPQYQHGAISWSPDGSQLLLHRFPITNPADGVPEIWTYHLTTQTLVRVVSDGFFPRWIP